MQARARAREEMLAPVYATLATLAFVLAFMYVIARWLGI
jgi:predicted small integral membrane protein